MTAELRVNVVRNEIGALVVERQRLREGGAEADALERNRLAIVQAQRELGFALVTLYLRPAQPQVA